MHTTISIDGLRAGVDDLVSAALLAEGWEEALTRFTHAAGARDAVLMRNAGHKMIAAVTTAGAKEGVSAFAAGQAPPNSRYRRVDSRHFGFRLDHDDYSDGELSRDPFYQEFLRPHGVFWHANTVLAPGPDEYVELSLKRQIERGPYQPGDRELLDGVLSELHAAARIAKGILDAETRGMTWLLGRRGAPIIELDYRGLVLPGQTVGDNNPSCPVRSLRRRLVATDSAAQRPVDRAIAGALSRPGQIGLAALTGADGRRYLLQVHPVPGRARDVFSSAAALALLFERDRRPATLRSDLSGLRSAYGLTEREVNVAGLLAEGLDINGIAARLGIRPNSARSYLKDALQKTGTTRQAELVALIARI